MSPAGVVLAAPGGARAEISPQGAQVLSWQPAGAVQSRLYLSPRARFEAGQPVRGGIPVLFPQFGLFGPLPKHGLVRAAAWHQLPAPDPLEAHFSMQDSAASRAHWPFAFELEVRIRLTPQSLAVGLRVANRDSRAFTFTAGLHTYLRLDHASVVRLEGLANRPYLDALDAMALRPASGAEPPARGAVDRVYLGATSPVTVGNGPECLQIEQTGFEDVVVWNPGAGSTLPDLPPGDHAGMLCVEAAQIGNPVTLAPGAAWEGAQILHALA